ncbi:tyrosine phosphatase family protein [Sulfuriroseicoccus oceanibius]|uniref:Dual specificity protein phosphatase family protein n=1 Tax=Sulfuriroseicoccus oceanibius TaxID=2707525 RepID=A0A6B3L4G7_9BACT|nr:dual specificity protein phosphatase family protein [Sulfuriroseicoccus oceanibius]QQL45239.1 dual specificity protein phosphatase family protein [Sulfuriroseicoccus oceanibius]
MPKGTPFKLAICGASELPELAKHPVTHVVSIWHPGAQRATYEPAVRHLFPMARILFAVFDDIASETQAGSEDRPPTLDQIERILEFTAGFRPGDTVGIHCLAGISRSSAVATAALAQHLGPGAEAQAIAKVREVRKRSHPNRLIIEYADQLLGRKGALVRAVETSFGMFSYESFKGWRRRHPSDSFYIH